MLTQSVLEGERAACRAANLAALDFSNFINTLAEDDGKPTVIVATARRRQGTLAMRALTRYTHSTVPSAGVQYCSAVVAHVGCATPPHRSVHFDNTEKDAQLTAKHNLYNGEHGLHPASLGTRRAA